MSETLPAGAGDDELLELLEQLLERSEREPDFELEAFLAAHPEQELRLRAAFDDLRAGGMVGGDPPLELVLPRSDPERYAIGELVGRGGVGDVYRAEDRSLLRTVALKWIRADLEPELRSLAARDLVERFVREARITGRLEHPGIVPVHDLGMREGRPFFTMKLVEGLPLASWLAAEGRPRSAREWSRWIEVLERAAQTLAFAHAAGVIHRDLKPSNLMVGGYGEVYLLDWGMAKYREPEMALAAAQEPVAASPVAAGLGGPESSGARLGTLEYMAPEQARGEQQRVDERTDVFGLGAILFQMLTGEAPFAAGERAESLAAARSGRPRHALEAADLPPELVVICRKAMAPEPAQRYSSVLALARDLEAFRLGLSGSAWRVPWSRRLAHRLRRHPVVSALSLVIVALAVAVGLGGWRMRRVERERSQLLATERRAELVQEIERWSTAGGAPFDPREQGRRHAQAAEALLARLAEWGIDLRRPVPSEQHVAVLAACEPDLAHDLEDALFVLTLHLAQMGLPLLDAWADEPALGARWSGVFERLVALLSAHEPEDAGAKALAAYLDARLRAEECKPLDLVDPGPRAPSAEIVWWAWVGEQLLGPRAGAEMLDAALAERPDLLWCHLRRGILALGASDWETARVHGTAALALAPRSTTAHDLLGLALQGRGELEAAQAQLLAALAIDPSDVARILLVTRESPRKLAAAIELLGRAHDVGCSSPLEIWSLAESLLQEGEAEPGDLSRAQALELLFQSEHAGRARAEQLARDP